MEASGTDAEAIAASIATPSRFAEIFDRHYDAVRGYVGRRLPAAAADEVASETFLVAFRRRADYVSSYASAKPWLLGIATHLIGRYRRDERRRIAAYDRIPPHQARDHTDESIDRIDAQARRPVLRTALLDLAPDDRDVLLLYALGGLTYGEVGEALQIPPGTVRSRLSRVRAKLGAVLASDYNQEGVRVND